MSWHMHAWCENRRSGSIRIRILGGPNRAGKNCARLRKIALGLRKIAPELRFRVFQNICMWGPHDQDPDHDEQGSWLGPWLVPSSCMLIHVQEHDQELANMYEHAWAMHACVDMRADPDPIDPAPCPSCMIYSASTCACALFFLIHLLPHPMIHVQPVHCTRWLNSHQLPQHHETQQQIWSYTHSRSLES